MPLRLTTDLDDRPASGAQHQPPPAPSFGRLARRIAIWTTRGLVCALVMLLAVGFGLQTLRWWHTEPGVKLPLNTVFEDPSSDPTQWHVLALAGQPWRIHHRMLQGDKSAAIESLRLRCRSALEQSPLDGVPATPLETRLLEQIAGEKPVDAQPGRWKLYCNDLALPMIIGVSDAQDRAQPAKSSGVDAPPRVLVWALAAQQAAEIWSLYVFEPQPGRSSVAAVAAEEVQVDLPPGAVRTLQFTVAPGGTVVVFQTSAGLEACRQFFDQWFVGQGWTTLGGWQRYGNNTRVARFRHGSRDVAADVHLSDLYTRAAGRQTGGLVFLWQGGR